MGITVAVTRVACSTGVGAQSITTSALGGLTPKAALFIVARCTADGTPLGGAVLGYGAATGASNQWAVGIQCQDAQASANTNRRAVTDQCVLILNTGDANVDGEAAFSAWIENGVTINWGNAPTSAYLMTAIFFAGTDLSAHANVFTQAAAQNDTVDVTDPGFEPDVLFTASHGNPFNDTAYTYALLSFGIVLNKASDEQYSIGFISVDAAAAGAVAGRVDTAYGMSLPNIDGTRLQSGEFGSFDADGFSCTTRDSGASGEQIGYLALAFGGAVSFEGGVLGTPTATGVQSVTDPNFRPQAAILGLSQMPAVNTAYTDGSAGSIGIAAFDASGAYCTSIQDEDAADPTDTQSLSDDTAVNLPQHDGTAGLVAGSTSFDVDGWNWNFTAVLGTARQYWYLAIGAAAAASATTRPIRVIQAGPSYELWLTSDAGVRIALIDNFRTLSASRVVNGIGWARVVLPASFDTGLLAVDRILQVWRAPAGGRLSLWRPYFVRKWRFEMRGEEESIVVSGPDCNDLLRRRIVVGYAGSSYAKKTDYADDMMKELVSQAILDTPTPVPAAGTRIWSNLSVAGDLSDGPSLSKSFDFGRLLHSSGSGALADLARAAREAGTEVFFDVVPAVVAGDSITLQFRTYTGQPGMDVSDRVVFDQARGNLVDPYLEYDYSEEINYVYAGGQGEGEARSIQQVYDATRYGASQWNRCEAFTDARNESTDDGVREAGRVLLEEGRPVRRAGGIPVDTEGTRFGRDWDFGYRVKARYRDVEFEAIIRSVGVNVDDDGHESIQARLEYET